MKNLFLILIYAFSGIAWSESTIRNTHQTLMLNPLDDETVQLSKTKPTLRFVWKEPLPDLTYNLELYFKDKRKLSKVLEVKGGEYYLQFKKVPRTLYWRVYPKKTSVEKRGAVISKPLLENGRQLHKVNLFTNWTIFKPTGELNLRYAAFLNRSTFRLETENRNLTSSLNGFIQEFNVEYFPRQWDQKRSINLLYRGSSLTSEGDDLKESKFGAEFGWLFPTGPFVHHQFFLGYYFFDKVEFNIEDDNSEFNVSFLSGRHFYRRQFHPKFAFELTSGLQIPLPLIGTPSLTLRPGLSYKIAPEWWIDLFGLYERFVIPVEATEDDEKINVRLQNMAIGIGISWNPGK